MDAKDVAGEDVDMLKEELVLNSKDHRAGFVV